MMHVLGFGTLWNYGANPLAPTAGQYIGKEGLAAYQAAGHPGATYIPVQTSGGAGTAGAHWSELALSNELMTPYINGTNYLSSFSRDVAGRSRLQRPAAALAGKSASPEIAAQDHAAFCAETRSRRRCRLLRPGFLGPRARTAARSERARNSDVAWRQARRSSGDPGQAAYRWPWVPAFAGMTVQFEAIILERVRFEAFAFVIKKIGGPRAAGSLDKRSFRPSCGDAEARNRSARRRA